MYSAPNFILISIKPYPLDFKSGVPDDILKCLEVENSNDQKRKECQEKYYYDG